LWLSKVNQSMAVPKPKCFICGKEDYNLYLVGVCKDCLKRFRDE